LLILKTNKMAKQVKNGLKETAKAVIEKAPVVKEATIEVVVEKEISSPGHSSRAFRQ
jgi:hypothetical protein